MVFDHYLTVQVWTPEFISTMAKIDRTMVLVEFPGLNLYYYDESILLVLAAAVGKPVKIYSNTLDVRRGRFAWVWFEIDLNKPVIGRVWLKDHWYQVEYEGLQRIWTRCPLWLLWSFNVGVPQKTSCTSCSGSSEKPAGTTPSSSGKQPPVGVGAETAGGDSIHCENHYHWRRRRMSRVIKNRYTGTGHWLVVKRKNRNNNKQPKDSNIIGRGKNPNDNGKKEKYHATRDVSNNHAKNSAKQGDNLKGKNIVNRSCLPW